MTLKFGDWPIRYAKFNSLTTTDIVQDAERYVQRHSDVGLACVYAVECDSGRARLQLIKDVGTWDIEVTKELTWRRRFEEFCPGRTTNIAMELLPSRDGSWSSSTGLARWSFRHDKFIPRLGRFQSGSFSQEADWERCTPEYALKFGVAE